MGINFCHNHLLRLRHRITEFSVYYAKHLPHFLMAYSYRNLNSNTLYQNSPSRENINNLYKSKILIENLQVLNKNINIIYYIYYTTNKDYSTAEYLKIHCSRTNICGKYELERKICNEHTTSITLIFFLHCLQLLGEFCWSENTFIIKNIHKITAQHQPIEYDYIFTVYC